MEGNGKFQELIDTIGETALLHRLEWKSAVRRTLGTADWRDDPERVAAAEAKRASRMARNIRNQK
jgi:hypothetical protein